MFISYCKSWNGSEPFFCLQYTHTHTHPHVHKSTRAEREKMWCCYGIIVLSKQPAGCCVRLVVLLAAGLGESFLRENKDSIHIRLIPVNGLGKMPVHTHTFIPSHTTAPGCTLVLVKTSSFLLFMRRNLSQSSMLFFFFLLNSCSTSDK